MLSDFPILVIPGVLSRTPVSQNITHRLSICLLPALAELHFG